MARNNRQAIKKPVESESSEEEEYEVERIKSHKVQRRSNKKVLQYYIKWKGYDSDENTWEPEDAVGHAAELVDRYWQEKGAAARKKVDQELGRAPKSSTKTADEAETVSTKRKRSSPELSANNAKKSKKQDNEEGVDSEEVHPYYESETDMDFSDSEVADAKFRINSNWADVSKVEAVRPADDGKSLHAIVRWNDGALARYNTTVVAKKSPLKLIDYYEKRLLFEKIR